MKTIAQLEAISADATRAHNDAYRRRDRIDQILAAMTLIDDVAGEGPLLGRAAIEAVGKADYAGAFAALTAIRKAIPAEIERLADAADAADRALNDAPEEAA